MGDTEERVLASYGYYTREFCTACANNWVAQREACKNEHDVVADVLGRDFRGLRKQLEGKSLYEVPRKCIRNKKQKKYENARVVRRLEDDTEELEDDTEERVLASYGYYTREFCTACANNWVAQREACKNEHDVVADVLGRDFRGLRKQLEGKSLYEVPRKCIRNKKQKKYLNARVVRRLEEDE